MDRSITNRVLGSADYEARWIGRTMSVRLTARGILPCSNFEAQLEKRPERILPAMWELVFYTPDYCEKALKPFLVNAIVLNPVGDENLVVVDATGEHLVPVQPAYADTAQQPPLDISGSGNHVVYARLSGRPDEHLGCFMVPEGTIVLAIYYRAYGPASKSECEDFITKTCKPDTDEKSLRGGEIPWPLLTDE